MQLFIATLFFLNVSCSTSGAFTEFNKALTGFTFKTIENIDWLYCIEACSVDVHCISYNFQYTKSGGTCEMNLCGFEDECIKDAMLVWVQGCVFQQLAPTKSKMTRCDYLKFHHGKNVSDVIQAHFTCSDEMLVFADGQKIISGRESGKLSCLSSRPAAVNFTIPRATRVVAIEVTGPRVPELLGSFDDGIVTNTSWKCSARKVDHWTKAEFNDTSWDEAEAKDKGDDAGTESTIQGVSLDAKWIGSKGDGSTMYCRIRRQ